MSKKKKSGQNKPVEEQKKKSKDNKNIIIIALAVVVVIALAAVGMQMKGTSEKASDSASAVDEQSLRKGETRETLSPSMFADPFIAEMYQVAREIPHVLDSVKCYCYCDMAPFNHKSLLSCFVDKHAAG